MNDIYHICLGKVENHYSLHIPAFTKNRLIIELTKEQHEQISDYMNKKRNEDNATIIKR